MMMYNCAIKEVTTKFEVLNADFSIAYKRNPIEMIKSRLKKPKSIFGKLERKQLPMTMESILENIGIAFQIKDDILGIFSSKEILGKSVYSDIEEFKQTMLGLNDELSKLNEEAKKLESEIESNLKDLFG